MAAEAFSPSLGVLIPTTEQSLQALPPPMLASTDEPSPVLDAAASNKMAQLLAGTDLREISRFKDVQEQEAVPFPASTPVSQASEGPKRATKSAGLSAGAASPASPALVPFEAGQSVDARFEGRSRWFPGVIQHINEDGTLAINYDDGDQEERVLQKHVRPSKSKASKETSVPNGSASKEAGVPNGSAARAAEPPAPSRASSSSGKPAPARTAKNGAASGTATTGAPPPSKTARKAAAARGAGAAGKREAAAMPLIGDGHAHERLQQLLQELDQGEDAAPPSRSTLQSISIEVRSLRPEEVAQLPTDELHALLEAVQPLLKPSRKAKAPHSKGGGAGASSSKRKRRNKGDDSSEEEARDEEEAPEEEPTDSSTADADDGRAFESALLTLNVLTLPQIPRELFIDESLEGVLQLCKHHVAMSGDDSSGGERKAPPKKARSPAASAPSSVSMLAQVLERVPALVAAHCLTDAQLLQLSALCLTAAFGQGPMALQLAGMEGALAVYTEYEAQRPAVLAELLEKRLSLPAAASREARRSYVLLDGSRVQMFTALMLFFVQSSAALPPSTDTDLALPATSPGAKSKGRGSSTTPGSVEAPEAATPEQAKAAQAAHPWSAGVTKAMLTMLRKVVSQCVEQPQDAEHKALAEELVRDVLLLFGRPEWPAAALCVKYIGAMLCNLVRSKEQKAGAEQSAARVFSLDLLGSVLATVAEQRRKHAEAPLVFPSSREVNEEAQPTDAGEDAECICAGGYNGAFMLDCDKCHRWFHGKCVGVAEAEEDLPAEWYCDSCQLSNAVADQRQRITRLLTLPEGGGGSDGEELELGCTEIEVTKQLAMNYLQTTVADPAAASAQQMLLCEWHAEAQEKKLVPLAKLYCEQFALVEAARRRQQALSGEERRVPLLTRDGILSASRRLLDHGNPSIFGRLESMLASVLSALNEPQASTRSKAIKALSASVGSDPAVLQMEAVKNGVHRALSDPAISVREATLDLVGQFIAQQPEFIETYYKTIASRLADTGVSVRKRVIKILRDICLRNPGSPRAIDACIHLVSRVSDEEEVQKLVIKTFQELWFAPPIEGRAEMQPHEVAERCRQLVAVTKAAGQRGAPPARAEWLGELLSLLLAEDLERKGMSKKEHTAILRVGTQLVSQLVETLLHESENAQPDPARLGSVLHALSIFCAARPTMLLPHVELLPTYLQYQHQEAAPAVRHVCEMLPRLLPLLDHPPRKLLEKLEKYLTALIFRVPEESMGGVIRALCAVCQVSKNTQLVGDTLARLCHLLRKQDAAAAPAAAIAAQTMRALLCSGLLCRHFDFDARGHETSALTCDGAHVLTGGKVNEDVFSILLPFAKQTTSAKAVQYAMKGLGHLCIRQPELAVRCKDVLGRALRAGAGSSPVLKQQALANLLMLLKAEQEKSKALREQRAALKAAAEASGTARKTPTEGSLEVEVHATAALTAVLQHHQGAVLHSLLDGREAAVRREGLHVVGAMLTQGLAHPAKCIPYVMALELDVGLQGCAELAKKVLRTQYDRYPVMVAAPGTFLDGAFRGYQLQRSLAAAAEQQQPQAAARTEAWPAFLYTLLNRKERLVYLKTLLSVLEPGKVEAQEREAPAEVLKRAEWTAQLLARLPFEREEEPLGLVHHINRLLSLHVDGFLDGLKRDLGDSDADAPLAPQELQRALASKQAELAPKCHAAALLCLAHLLKGHLKRLYQLSDAMCQTFDPTDTSSKGRPVTKLADKMVTMDSAALSALPPRFEAPAGKQPKSKKAKVAEVAEVAESGASDAAPPAEQAAWLGVGYYLWLKQLVDEDEAFDFNIIAATHSGEVSGGKRTPAKRPRPKAADGGRGSGRGSGRGGRGSRGSAAKPGKPKPSKKRKGKADSSDEDDSDADDDEYMDDE